MLNWKKSFIASLGLICLAASSTLFAQNLFKNTPDSKIIVRGTSTLHNWSMETQIFDCTVSVNEILNDQALVDQIAFSLQVENLKSDISGLNKNAYKALKTDEIQFHSTQSDPVQISANQVSGTIAGDLTVAGTTRPISFPFEGKINNENELETLIIYKINMKDYNIKPPTFFGILKTGANIEVIIQLKLRAF
jgi:polyisoprenoid-binding protein YceI